VGTSGPKPGVVKYSHVSRRKKFRKQNLISKVYSTRMFSRPLQSPPCFFVYSQAQEGKIQRFNTFILCSAQSSLPADTPCTLQCGCFDNVIVKVLTWDGRSPCKCPMRIAHVGSGVYQTCGVVQLCGFHALFQWAALLARSTS